jgi:hypothetical protein
MPKRYYYSRPLTEPEPGQKLDNILDKIRGGEVLEVPSADHVAYDLRGLKAILDRLLKAQSSARCTRLDGELTRLSFALRMTCAALALPAQERQATTITSAAGRRRSIASLSASSATAE